MPTFFKFRIRFAVLFIILGVFSLDAAGPPIPYTRLAVMPFKNLTGNPDKSWLGEGIAETRLL